MSRLANAIEMAAKLREDQARKITVPTAPAAAGRVMPTGVATGFPVVDPLPLNHPYLAGWHGRHEQAGEQFRKLRSAVVQSTRGETFDNVLMVTSTMSGEGKTLTAINLSLALAHEYDLTVLLVDGDFRKPSVHKYLGIDPDVGLIQCLKEDVPLHRALVKTGHGRLVVLPAGGAIDDPVELLASNRLKEIVRELKYRYPDRYIIFDSPPVLPVADAHVLSRVVDRVLFVVNENGPKLSHVEDALRILKDANLLGVIYNSSEAIVNDREYYYQEVGG